MRLRLPRKSNVGQTIASCGLPGCAAAVSGVCDFYMTGRERVIAMMEGRATDRLPFMPITMMFAADRIGAKYSRYAKDHRVMVEAQLRVAEEFDIDSVSTISNPAREASDYGAEIEWFDDQPPALIETRSLLSDQDRLKTLKPIDPLGGGRMHDRIEGVAMYAGTSAMRRPWKAGWKVRARKLRTFAASIV